MQPRSLWWRGVIGAGLVTALWLGCTPPLMQTAPLGGGGGGGGNTGGAGGSPIGFDAGPMGPPAADAGGLCGNQIQSLVTDPPNVYFVLDTSGSMAEVFAGGTKLHIVQSSATKVVTHLHLLINAGAAAFPGFTSETNPGNTCAPGHEVFPLTFNSATAFNDATKVLVPFGGTPTAATLASLLPKLSAIPGKTLVVLATDGGPNCDAAATCDAADCTENIEGCAPGDTCCADNQNCCAQGGPAGPLNCVDQPATVAAIAALDAAGIRVAVIGVPGSQYYAKVLSAMALAGGASLPAYPFYYKVDDLSTFIDVVGSIAAGALSCDVTLAAPPQDPSLTNVYLDQEIVLSDPVDGWSWTSPSVVTLNGASCAKLKSGLVAQVQVVTGCPTQAAP